VGLQVSGSSDVVQGLSITHFNGDGTDILDGASSNRGQPQSRPSRIGGRRTLLRTREVRTLAMSGGSLVHLAGAAVAEGGPRSAHIAY